MLRGIASKGLIGLLVFLVLVASTPSDTQINLMTQVKNILGVSNGGTGLSDPGKSGNVLTSNGSVWVSSTPAAGGGVTTTGSPANGNLTKFSGPTSITNGDLSGDVTTSGSLVTTLATVATAGACGDATHSCTTTIDVKGRVLSQASNVIHTNHGISFAIGDPAGSALTVASTTTDYISVPFACTINRYTLQIDAGTITVKFWKVALGTAIPTSGNSINTSGVGISSGTAVTSTSLGDFTTTSVAANDAIAMNVTAVATAKFVNGVLSCQE
jgi:hypothetical protein